MPYKYKIDVDQLTNKVTYTGEMDSLNEVSGILKQVEKKLVKDETAKITFSYTEINEKKIVSERAKIRKIVEEEYGKIMGEKG
ncbi:MAG: hypothetical protein LKF54_00125 [Bacilli bacterium]|jgi:hypothetical protein|nr:hypothetical protein [Bacilli bacterium]